MPAPPPGPFVIVRVLAVSIDPAMRGWMSTAKSYLPPVAIGDVCAGSPCDALAGTDSRLSHR